jgi:ribosomal protein S15P/S13E
MAVTKEDKARLVKEFGAGEKNTGSTEVQIALLTERIVGLTEHFKTHKKDTNSRPVRALSSIRPEIWPMETHRIWHISARTISTARI